MIFRHTGYELIQTEHDDGSFTLELDGVELEGTFLSAEFDCEAMDVCESHDYRQMVPHPMIKCVVRMEE